MAVQRDKVIASAEKLVAKGKIEPAIKEYERLLDDNPNDVNTLNRIGDLWVRINRNDEAVKVFGRIADHYARDGFFLKAIAIFKKINKLDPSKLEVYAKLADLYAKQGLAMEAKSQYQVLADYYLKHGDPANALAIYRKISELDPNSINVHVKLADLYSQNNQTQDALKEYDRVGRLLLKRGMLDEAVQVYRKALKIDASNLELIDSLVTALIEAKDFENATQIIQTSLETNRDNGKLLAMLGRVQVMRGDIVGARATLERAFDTNPDEAAVREGLADVSLRQGEADRALQMIAPLSERALGRGERTQAVDLLTKILRVDSGHTPTLERLVALYTRLNEETNVLASMNSLAEAHIAKGRYEDAANVLEKLIQKEPQNAQHRTKLQFVKSQTGGVDTLPVRPKAEAPPVSLEIEEPPPSFDMSIDEEPALSLDLDASEPLELDMSEPMLDVEPEPAPAPAPKPTPAPAPAAPPAFAASAPAAASIPEPADDLDFITEHLTEAEVFAKYGLAEKAVEHLRIVLERSPRNETAHERLFRLLLDEGDVDGARAAALRYVGVLQESGNHDAIGTITQEFLSRGHAFSAPSASPAAKAPAAAAAAPAEEPTIDFEEPADFEIDLDSEVAATPVEAFEAGIAAEPEPEPELTVEPEPEFSLESQMDMVVEETETAISFEEQPSELSFGDLNDETPVEEAGISLEPEPVTDFGATDSAESLFEVETEQAAPGAPSFDELSEIDFYIEQELFDEARTKVDALLARFPGSEELAERSTRIAEAAAAQAAPPPQAASRPAPISRDEIESELLSAIPDDEEDIAPAIPAAPPAAASAAPFAASPVQEENLFSDEEDFFDLAAELESELEEDEPLALGEEEQSLEEIFKEFKKGVEQQLDSEDYDTHYNLGIAYKEMGLIDEAIGEFQLASKDPKRAVECASMLGLCFLEKGMPQLAIKWYQKGLEMAELTEEEHIGLLYDLAAAYQEVGDTEQAQKSFLEVYGMNTNYRDVVSRIKQLDDARK